MLPADLAHARELGGTLKPVVHAAGLASDAPVAAFAGPAFVPERHPLARVHQALNGLCLRDIAGSQLCFTGPGAGPDVTAVTVLDDVVEAVVTPVRECWPTTARSGLTVSPATAMVRPRQLGRAAARLGHRQPAWRTRRLGRTNHGTRLARRQRVAGNPDVSLRQTSDRTGSCRARGVHGIDTTHLPGTRAAHVKRGGVAGARHCYSTRTE